jgi:hypothetical protein
MSGHWRFCVSAFVLVAGLSTAPAFSNPLTDLFNPAPQEAAAPVPAPAAAPEREAKDECLMQPGTSTPGRHWVYHLNGHRKCWYQADEATIAAKKQAHHRVARQAVDSEENEAAPRKKMVADARAQMLSAAPADAVQPPAPPPAPSPAPEVADAAPVPASEPVARVSAAPVVATPTIDQAAPEATTPRPVDVEMLLAAAAPVGDRVASPVPPAPPVAPSTPDMVENQRGLTATRAGMALITLGLIFLIGSLLASRFLDAREAPAHRA